MPNFCIALAHASPTVSPAAASLYSLAKTLKVSYSELMKLAGYVVESSTSPRASVGGGMLARALSSEDLTEQEAEELAKYLAWYRSRQGTRRGDRAGPCWATWIGAVR
jgi:hypothetical protein